MHSVGAAHRVMVSAAQSSRQEIKALLLIPWEMLLGLEVVKGVPA